MTGRSTNNNNALGLFVKAPVYGTVKTRLHPAISKQMCLDLYQAMTEDLVDRFYGHSDFDLIVFFYPADQNEKLERWLCNVKTIPQQGENLGERMLNAIRELTSSYDKVLLIGSDLPALSLSIVQKAFKWLDKVNVVLGPAEDGGYYLIGVTRALEPLFSDIKWSTRQVLDQTLTRCKENRYSTCLLEPMNDIDTIDDLKQFARSLNHLQTTIKLDKTKMVLKILNTRLQND